jgi:hypothetical protein
LGPVRAGTPAEHAFAEPIGFTLVWAETNGLERFVLSFATLRLDGSVSRAVAAVVHSHAEGRPRKTVLALSGNPGKALR